MNKILLISLGFLLLFLVACNEDEPSTKQVEKSDLETISTDEPVENKQKENDQYTFTNDIGKFSLVGMYINENINESGFYELDFKGFKLNLVPSLVDIELSESAQAEEKYKGKSNVRAILLTTKAENTNEFDVDYNGTIAITTDTKEQLNTDKGLMASNPIVQTYIGKVKQEGIFVVPIEDMGNIPKSIQLIIDPPYKVIDGAVDPVNGVLGEQKRVDFEFIPKEEME